MAASRGPGPVAIAGDRPSAEEWDEIARRLAAPFDPTIVDFRVLRELQGGRKAIAAYVDARAVQDRLDEVVGIGHWQFAVTPLGLVNGVLKSALGTLTIHGVSKTDAGDAGDTEPTKATVSDALKRAAVMWSVGRYLYDLPFLSAEFSGTYIPDQVQAQLRAKLPRPGAAAARADAGETRPGPAARATTPAPAPAPAAAAPGRAGPETQKDLALAIQGQGFGVRGVREFVLRATGRTVDEAWVAALQRHEADLTLDEYRRLMGALGQPVAAPSAASA